jgi:phospholipid-binding lipoprotein MlaA
MARLLAIAALACAVLLPPAWAVDPPVERAAAIGVDPSSETLDIELEAQPACFPDPLEGFNRVMFRFNDGLDRCLVDPITRAYRFVVPGMVRRAVVRALENLESPAILANDVLQLHLRKAGRTATRFVVNTTAGGIGLVDVAAKLGIERHTADFGQTLALLGVPSGPYLVLPVLGPTTARDGFGRAVDLLFRPTTYLLGPAEVLIYTSVHGGTMGIARRDAFGEGLRALRESSVDLYAAVRSAHYQSRTAEIGGVAVARADPSS